MNSLNQQYEEKVRPCIDLIDSLRSLGVEKDLALPAIAVIGDQSSGKSSVLEALSGVALPRGSGIVTRCPLELKMKRRKEGEGWYGKISYQDFEEELKDLAGVEKKIREAQNKIAGPGSGISHELISLEIASPDVPDLTLIDLPGITRVAVKGQKGNIENQPYKLAEEVMLGGEWDITVDKEPDPKFITKQKPISLVVVPCNVDIATTEALKMAQEVDPEGERTLGIMTKPDLVDKGYMIVKCRGQKEIKDKVSLTEALEREEAFFSEHAYFKTLYDEGRATVPKLAEKLTLELVDHIKRSLPRLEEQIEKKLKTTQANLDKCGHGPPPDATERIGYLIDRVTAFTQDATSLATGEELEFGGRPNIFSILRKEFAAWKDVIEDSGVNFHWNIEKEVNQYERKYRGRELPGFINYKTFEGMVKEQIKQLEGPALLKLKGVTEIVKKELLELAQSSLVGLPNLIRTAQMKIEAITKEKEAAAESMLRTQFKMEMIVYTQDSTYGKKLGKRKREEGLPTVASVGAHIILNSSNSGATLKEMLKHLKSYYQIAGQRLADQIPLVIRYHVMQESALQLHREMLQMLQDKEKTECLLQEDFSMETKRRQLQNSLKRMLQEVTIMNSLNQQYEEKVRPCIDLIDSLRSLGVEKDLALPAIAVIGDQSRGRAPCWRRCQGWLYQEEVMKRKKEGEEWYGKISYQDFEEEIDDPVDVEKKIREAQDEIAGLGGQDANIGDRIKSMIQKFIRKQETISLVVVPCNVDIATTEALKMAQEVDPEGERTLGILTKPDLVDRGTEENVVNIVKNEVIYLKKGYMIVKCRGQKEITEKVSLTEAIEREKTFFSDHAFFHSLYNDGHATIPKLAEKLTLELVLHIEKSLPRLEEQIEEKLAETQAQLERYGNGPPSDTAEKIYYLLDKVTAFTHDAINLTTGEELKCGDSFNIFSMLRNEFGKWNNHLLHSGEKFNKKIEKEVEEYEAKYRGRELPGFINYRTFETMVKDQIKQLEEPAVKKLKDVGDAVRKVFIQLAQSSFIGFPKPGQNSQGKDRSHQARKRVRC
ncbi:Interferon-induced GTP-binding protein Mx [Dissostichus eleginoides]|uniref:Interferon-induced GTP-binding protein Mx n=1 Tax=Dissostichus eleginoides TaxID=100907 RepID=A0AAD9FFT7_DISEL|nr:Interferon-induced GTP-binding protein Mx [Dissostichus eleginoides]